MSERPAQTSQDRRWGVPRAVGSVLVFGGSFDPPTKAHVELPPVARDRAGLDWLLLVPAAESPGKGQKPFASEADRLAMLRAAVGGLERCSVCDVELERARSSAGPSYTVDTLAQLRSVFGDAVRLRLLMGADQAAAFHTWREPHQIMRMAEPLVMLRSPSESWEGLRSALAPHWPEPELRMWQARTVALPTLDVSSTRARRLIQEQGPVAPELAAILPPAVLTYIRRNGLYGRAGGPPHAPGAA